MGKPKMSNAERQRAFRARNKNDPERTEVLKRKNRENVRKHRMSEKYKTETKEAVRLRKRKSRAMKRLQKENVPDTPVLATPALADDPPSTYSHRSSLSRAVNKAISSLPGTPRRNKQVIRELALKVKLDFSKSKKRQSSRKALTEKTIQTVKTFYLRDDISRWSPGKRDTIVVKENHVKQTMQRRYLQLSINELHAQFISENLFFKSILLKITTVFGKTKYKVLIGAR